MVCICGHKSASEVIDGEDTAIVNDKSADSLSHVGGAAYNSLKRRNARYHHRLWNVTKGKVIGDIQQTPLPEDSFLLDEDPGEGHSDWFPQKMCEIMSKTKYWCDMMSLTPPDGIFLEKIKEAIETISANAEQTVIIRMMFGNIVGMPVACTSVIRALTKDLPADSHIQLYVAGWRKRTSWNHAKMIAVDGRYLHTGGHNMWSHHYLTYNPVHDLSIEMEGRITHDAHIYANEQWSWVEKKERTFIGKLSEALIPDSFPTLWKNRVNYDHFPSKGGTKFPAEYNKTTSVPKYDNPEGLVPCISIGRSGKLLPISRPADNAILAMMNSAKKNIRMSLQDLGPVCVPGTKIPLVGLKWPKPYLKALAKKIWNGVKVEIVLSNPASVPGGDMFASYGNGWSCADCASEIIKCVRKQVIMVSDHKLRKKVQDNLRLCFIKHKTKKKYFDGNRIGNHSKFFMIDDVCCYVGSQNLYVCDLAEWGVVIDDEPTNVKILADYWNPMWEASYTPDDCDVNDVMDGLKINRDAPILKRQKKSKQLDGSRMSVISQPRKSSFYESEVLEHNDE